ncbi:hypothetical protein GCM10018952_55260 [Streptosporangium vulgare]
MPRLGDRHVAFERGQAEVGEHGPVVGHQDVARLHVAVQDPLGVHGAQRAQDLTADLRHLARRQRAVVLEELLQRSGAEQLHHDPGTLVLGDDVEDGDDGGMGDHRGRASLALGPGAQLGAELLVEDEGQAHLLDGHLTVEQLVVCPPNGAHAAAPNRF